MSTWDHPAHLCPPGSTLPTCQPSSCARGQGLRDILKAGVCSVLTSTPSSAQGLAPGGPSDHTPTSGGKGQAWELRGEDTTWVRLRTP